MRPTKKLAWGLATLVVLVGLNQIFEHGFGDFQINPYYARVIELIGINVTLAVSLNLINGVAGQFSIGHAGFMAVGGYVGTYLTVYYGEALTGWFGLTVTDAVGGSMAMVVSLVGGAVAAGIAGLAVGIPSLRLKGDYLAIVTLGFGEIIRVVILNIPAVGGATGFTRAIPITNFFWIFAMAILTIVIVRNLTASTFGRALATIRDDEVAAEAIGIRTTWHKVMAFVVSAALAGVAGALSGQLFANPLNPQNLNFVKSIEVIIMIVLGGVGSITGAVLGATTLTILPEVLRGFDQEFPGLRMVMYALLLILMMIFRPQGLLGRREFGWHWLRWPSRSRIPVALTEVSDTRAHMPQPPGDPRAALGEDEDEREEDGRG
jgi:branched-chain amino acid transport system permease protein